MFYYLWRGLVSSTIIPVGSRICSGRGRPGPADLPGRGWRDPPPGRSGIHGTGYVQWSRRENHGGAESDSIHRSALLK